MSIKIESMNATAVEPQMSLRNEYGELIEAYAIASDAGTTIAHYDAGENWAAIIVTDYGDGDAVYDTVGEGTTFGVTCQDEYVVRRTDSAGSLKWVENV